MWFSRSNRQKVCKFPLNWPYNEVSILYNVPSEGASRSDEGQGGKTMKMLKELHGRAIALMSGLDRITRQRVRARLWKDDKGNAIVEFALVLVPLMLFITGIFSFGMAMMNYESLTHAVAQGAQTLVTSRTSTLNPCADTLASIESAAPTLAPGSITLTITMGTNSAHSGTNLTCSGAQSELSQGESVTVAATYPCNISVAGYTPSPTCNMSASVTEYEF